MKNYVSEGKQISHTLTAAAVAGDGHLVGSLFGVAVSTGAIGDKIALATEGVFKLASASGTTYSVGDVVGWDNTGKLAVAAVAGDKDVAVCTEAKIAGTLEVECKIQSGL
jgi:predicted RecA/RadA family phage recombinase